jgi:hypothetical protein
VVQEGVAERGGHPSDNLKAKGPALTGQKERKAELDEDIRAAQKELGAMRKQRAKRAVKRREEDEMMEEEEQPECQEVTGGDGAREFQLDTPTKKFCSTEGSPEAAGEEEVGDGEDSEGNYGVEVRKDKAGDRDCKVGRGSGREHRSGAG